MMTTTQGPLDTIPKANYPPLLTKANYMSTKQLINEVLSEDREYVTWKLNQLRTGGNDAPGAKLLQTVAHHNNRQFHKKNAKVMKKRYPNQISGVPPNLTFVQDLYEKEMKKESEDIDKSLREMHQPSIPADEQFKLLVTNLDEDQTNRFEVFHRTALSKTQVKKLATTVVNQSINENIRVFLQAIGKIFAGEIIEKAMEIKEKWLLSLMHREFDRKEETAMRLKKLLKKLTKMVDKNGIVGDDEPGNGMELTAHDLNNEYPSSVDEEEEDIYLDDEPDAMKKIQDVNSLLRSQENTAEIRLRLISHYNELVRQFNELDVSVEKYNSSPLLPEHIREAWRLHRLQSETIPPASWRTQGSGNGQMFR
ncbi:hTAFII28-like protein conserved region [Nakaseomyces glabratus]|nr:hTAFII28-like protein conserved region [Nakaseomyces glabratus]KAH7592167.1 hTAFII28-like protein conserved region [Nakaseomyces glabratus]KAI8396834.1 hTAFII28-like protein conserved region [Nakaseomyces glabratus]